MAKRKTARSGARTRGRATPAARTAGRSGTPRTGKKAAAARTGARKAGARKAGARKRRPAGAAGAKAASGRKRTPAGRKTSGSSRKPAAPTRRTSPAKGSSRARTGAKATSRTLPTRKTKKAAGTRTAAGRRATSPSTRARRPLGKRDRPVHDATERDRRLLEETVQSPPSSLDLDRSASAARSGRAELDEALLEHTETGPAMTGGDVDADWESAYSTGDEAPGGDMPTPDQSVVEEIATSVGVEYADNEELKGVDKIEERDRHRWEYDPASSEDYRERTKRK